MQTDPTARGAPVRRRGRLTAVALTVVVAGALVSSVLFLRPQRDGRGQAGGITMPALGGGGEVALAAYRGRPVVLNFFASWCVFCAAEMPDFQKVHAALGDKVAFVGVAMQDDPEAARRLAERTGVTYDLADDPSGDVFERLGARGMPTTVFIDEDGRVVERFTGPLSERALRDRVAEHFAV